MTSTKSSSPAAVPLAIVLGVVLLVGLVGFAVGLPKLQDDTSRATSGATSGGSTGEAPDTITLPAQLPGDLVSSSSPDFPPELLQKFGTVDAMRESVDSARAGVGDLYGQPSAFDLYGAAGGAAGGTLTVVVGAAGLYLPQGPPVASPDSARASLVTERVDGAVCSSTYAAAIPAGQPVPEGDAATSVQCQLAQDGLVFEFSGGGLATTDVVAALHAAADAQR